MTIVPRILNMIAARTQRSPVALLRPDRTAAVALHRHIAIWLASERSDLSVAQMAIAFRVDRSSIYHAIRRIDVMRARRSQAKQLTDHLLRALDEPLPELDGQHEFPFLKVVS